MHSASEEWVARVRALNEIETAKAMGRALRPTPHEKSGLRAVPLSAGARPGLADGSAKAGREAGR